MEESSNSEHPHFLEMAAVTKKLINRVEDCVRECCEGLVAVHPGLSLVEGHNVVVRTDALQVAGAGKVVIISGGGSGHEPSHSGLIGKGHLTASACGAVFASPSPACIMAAVSAVSRGQQNCSILMIVKNYTGDRLNFGIACERAQVQGHQAQMVVVGEDCALSSVDHSAGQRGLAGTLFIHKIAGAMAEQGKSLQAIVSFLNQTKGKMGTIGLSLSPCSVPGSGPNFTLGADEMELGLGIHGEAGVRRINVMTAKESVKAMLDHMTNPQTTTHLDIKEGDRVALLVNNLGGLSMLELNIVAKEAILYLESSGAHVERAYSGTFMTSLEMAGVSISILHIDDTITAYLDYPSSAPAWRDSYLAPGQTVRKTPDQVTVPSEDHVISQQGAETLDSAIAAKVKEALKAACECMVAMETTLNDLDSGCGDGDCGSTMARGAQAILSRLQSSLPVHCPHTLALHLAHILEDNMGGTSGPIYSLLLTGLAQELHTLDQASLTRAVGSGLDAVMKYGGAKPGYRTLVDPLNAAYETLRDQEGKVPVAEAIKLAAKASSASSASTAGMRAQAGRSSYVNPEMLARPDPGAVALAAWVDAIAQTL